MIFGYITFPVFMDTFMDKTTTNYYFKIQNKPLFVVFALTILTFIR